MNRKRSHLQIHAHLLVDTLLHGTADYSDTISDEDKFEIMETIRSQFGWGNNRSSRYGKKLARLFERAVDEWNRDIIADREER